MYRYGENEKKPNGRELSTTQLLFATFRHLRKPFQLLLIPLSFWYGVSLGFFGIDFTVVSCVSIYIMHNILCRIIKCTTLLFLLLMYLLFLSVLQGFISCVWGVEYIGYAMICYGVCAGIFSFVSGTIIKYIGRVPVFIFPIATSIVASIIMLKWEPSENEPIFFFIISGIWGTMEGSLTPQINGLFYFKTLKSYFELNY